MRMLKNVLLRVDYTAPEGRRCVETVHVPVGALTPLQNASVYGDAAYIERVQVRSPVWRALDKANASPQVVAIGHWDRRAKKWNETTQF